MLDRDTRAAVLKLAEREVGVRAIARALKISRNTVRAVLASGLPEVAGLERQEQLDPHIDLIRSLVASCKGNLVRVHEELESDGIEVAYSTLTSFCRRREIGTKPKRRAGQYHFEPGQEMQHDTSPHKVEVGGHKQGLVCASLVQCYSRMQYAQLYPRWTRFEARVFLTEAIPWLGGASGECMLDNSTVIMIGGTGKDAVAAPAMKALSDRFGFAFVAHRVGHADRSGRVERPFHHIENNFYAGREFADLADANEQLKAWCSRNNRRFRKRLQASPAELHVAEAPVLKALPVHIPEVYELHRRRVDVEGYVSLHTNRYSVDARLIDRHVEIRETVDRVRVFDGHRLVEEHDKVAYGARKRRMLAKHKGQQRRTSRPAPQSAQEVQLRKQSPEFTALVDALQRRYGGRAVKAVGRLYRMWSEYPTEAMQGAVSVALQYGLTDLARVERMVLQRIAGDFFQLPIDPEENPDG